VHDVQQQQQYLEIHIIKQYNFRGEIHKEEDERKMSNLLNVLAHCGLTQEIIKTK
jgi:hypothetical protein